MSGVRRLALPSVPPASEERDEQSHQRQERQRDRDKDQHAPRRNLDHSIFKWDPDHARYRARRRGSVSALRVGKPHPPYTVVGQQVASPGVVSSPEDRIVGEMESVV